MSAKGTYAKLTLGEDSKKKITAIATLINLENYARPQDLHSTIIYSRQECPSVKDIAVELPIKADGIKFDVFLNADGTKCLVLLLESLKMTELHNNCKNNHGATHDYPAYIPHLTLSYDYENGKLPNEEWIEYFKGLTFDQYIVEPLNFDWVKKEHFGARE